MMASRRKKLSDLKEGDEAIFVCVRESGDERSVAIISKVKGNRIRCGAASFDRATGLPVGNWRSDPSVECYLTAATKTEIKAVLDEHRVEMARRRAATLVDRLADRISALDREDVVSRLRRLATPALHELADAFEVEK
jgi:hypothetical protein